MRDSADFTSYLGEFGTPGEESEIALIRDNTRMEISIEIGKRQN